MRVVIVSNLFPPDIGGPATYAPRIASELQARGHSVSIIGGAPAGFRASADRATWPYPVHRVSRGLAMPWRLLAMLFALIRTAWRADCIYVQGLSAPEMVAVLFGSVLRRAVVLKIVGDNAWEYAIRTDRTDDGIVEFQTMPYGWPINFVRVVVRWFARRATRLIVPSHFLGGLVQGWGVPRTAVRVVTNALTTYVADERERAEAREWVRAQVGRSGPFVVAVARLYPWKNVDVLIRMVNAFPSTSTLLIIGDGPESARLHTIIEREGYARRVVMTGGLSHDETQKYLRGSDVFVLNTRYEGLSHVLLEAMAAGVPAAVSDIGGNPEVIRDGENGLLFTLDDRVGIARAIARLINDHALIERIRAQATEDVRSYRWSVLVEQTARTLEDAGGAPRPPDRRA